MSDTIMLMLISIGIFVAMYLFAMITQGEGFRKAQMLFDLLNDNAYLIIISCALTIVMIGGGINISVGGVISLTVMSGAIFLNSGIIRNDFLCILVTFLLALGIGLGFGLLHGFLVSYLDIQPFIVTLAGMFLARGLTTILSVNPVSVENEGFLALVKAKLKIGFLGYASLADPTVRIPAKIEIGAIVAIVVVILVFLLLRYTKLGRNIYAVGGNRQSALMLGINVKSTIFWSHVLSGLLSGLAGFIFLMHKPAGNASVAMRSEMDAIASSIIGGTLLTGGVGNVFGTFFGTMILATIQKIIGLSPRINASWWQDMSNGAMLCFFILLQSIILMRRNSAKTRTRNKAEPRKKKLKKTG